MNNKSAVPFLDLSAIHKELEPELVNVFLQALRKSQFIGGPEVEGFEKEFATFCGTDHSIGVGSGTDALRFALIAVGLKPGETVVTVPNTFIATAEAITQAGGIPDFVDVDGETLNMDPAKLEAYLKKSCYENASGRLISRRTGGPVAAVIPVHLFGQMADMDPILDLAEAFGLTVVEDACQAHGASYFSRSRQAWFNAGSLGRAAAFSFYPGKNLGACGEGGAVTTNDPEVALSVRRLRDHGQRRKYYHEVEGYNGRLDSIQAGILRVKLRALPSWNTQRRECARRYDQLLGANPFIRIPCEPSWARSVYHLYVIRSAQRDALAEHLNSKQVYTGLHYPVPLHHQSAYAHLGINKDEFRAARSAAGEILSLPIFPGLTSEAQQRVVDEIEAFLMKRAPELSRPAQTHR